MFIVRLSFRLSRRQSTCLEPAACTVREHRAARTIPSSMSDHTSSNSKQTSARIRSTVLFAPAGNAAKRHCENSFTNSSPAPAPTSKPAPSHLCGPSPRRTTQTRSARQARSDSLSSPCRSMPSSPGSSGTNPPSNPVAIASHTLMLRTSGQALFYSGETTPIQAWSWVVGCVRRSASMSVSTNVGTR